MYFSTDSKQIPKSKIPQGDLRDKWSNFKNQAKLISPNNRNKYHVIIVGTGLS